MTNGRRCRRRRGASFRCPARCRGAPKCISRPRWAAGRVGTVGRPTHHHGGACRAVCSGGRQYWQRDDALSCRRSKFLRCRNAQAVAHLHERKQQQDVRTSDGRGCTLLLADSSLRRLGWVDYLYQGALAVFVNRCSFIPMGRTLRSASCCSSSRYPPT